MCPLDKDKPWYKKNRRTHRSKQIKRWRHLITDSSGLELRVQLLTSVSVNIVSKIEDYYYSPIAFLLLSKLLHKTFLLLSAWYTSRGFIQISRALQQQSGRSIKKDLESLERVNLRLACTRICVVYASCDYNKLRNLSCAKPGSQWTRAMDENKLDLPALNSQVLLTSRSFSSRQCLV